MKKGDQVEVAYTEALALSVEPAEGARSNDPARPSLENGPGQPAAAPHRNGQKQEHA